VLRFLTNEKESEEILAEYMKNAFLRQDVLDSLTELLVLGAKKVIEDKECQDYLSNFLIRMVYNQQVKDATLESLVYSPIKKFFTFGYGGRNLEEEKKQQEFEAILGEKREEIAKNYEPDRSKRNKYPGWDAR
jgi:hypothetical protein